MGAKSPQPATPPLDGADEHPIHSDSELVRRWLRAQQAVKQPGKGRGVFLWARVSEQFCVGSTSARDVCNRHGFHPDKLVKRS